jgi:acetyl-CoA carboxylase biotin carboxylase subunit
VLPGGFGVRVDTHIYAGYDLPPYYDPLLAKLIVWGRDRNEAIARMSRCLGEMEIGGIKTNTDFHLKIMGNAFFRKGDLSTSFLRRRMLNSAA